MAFKESDYLPTAEELDFPDLNVSSAALRAGAHHGGKYCDQQSKEYMLCKDEERDPRKCFKQGIEVSKCFLEFYQKVKKNCYDEFTSYFHCMDHAGVELEYRFCRKEQKVFDKCMDDKLSLSRPELGYFSKVRLHHTDRPRPYHHLELPDPTPERARVDSVPVPESVKLGSRYEPFS